MADNKGSIRTLVGYDLDKASLNQVLAANDAFSGSTTKAVEAVNTRFASSLSSASPRVRAYKQDIDDLRQGIADYTAGIDTVDAATKRWDGDLTSLRNSIKGVKDATAGGIGDVGADVTGGGGGDIGGIGKRISRFGSAARLAVPAIPLGNTGISSEAIFNITRLGGALISVAEKVPGVTAAAEALTPVIGATAAGFTAALIPVAAVAIALTPLIVALKILSDREAEAAKSAKELADVFASQADAFAVGQEAIINRNEETKKSAVELFNSLNDSFRTNVEKISFLNDKKKNSDEKTAAEIQKTIDATTEEQIKLSGSIDILRGNLQQLGVQIDGTAPGLSKVGDGTNNFFTTLLGKFNDLAEKAKTKLEPIGEAIAKFAEEAKKKADKEVAIVEKLNKDLVAIDQKAADDRKTIGVKLIDSLAAINSKALEDAEKIAADLDQQQAASALKLSRDENNATERANFNRLQREIDFQRSEIAARKRHDLELKQLREDAADQEFEDSLDRNFAAVNADRRAATKAVNRLNENFNAEEQARLDSFTQKNEDAQRQFAFEHKQRLQAYQEQAADQIVAANRALKQNELDRRRLRVQAQAAALQDYADLYAKVQRERELKNAAAVADLNVVIQTQAVMRQAYEASLAKAQELLNGVTGSGSGGGTSSGGGGGPATPTQNIAARAGGASRSFPTRTASLAGAGAGGGRGGNNVNVTIPVTLTGADPATIERTMTRVARNVTADAIERMNR